MKENKMVRDLVFSGIICYFLLETAYNLLLEYKIFPNRVSLIIFMIVCWILLGFLLIKVNQIRYRESWNLSKIEKNDERGQLIHSQANSSTMYFTYFILAFIYVFALIKNYKDIQYIIQVSYLLIVIFNAIMLSRLDKRH